MKNDTAKDDIYDSGHENRGENDYAELYRV